MAFVDSISTKDNSHAERIAELYDISTQEGLSPNETKKFVEGAFRYGAIPTTGTTITKILPPVSRFSSDGGHSGKKQHVLVRLGAFFERFFGLSAEGK